MQVRRCGVAVNSAISSVADQAPLKAKGYEIAPPDAAPANILEKIVWHKQSEVAAMQLAVSEDRVQQQLADLESDRQPKDFYGTLAQYREQPTLIAEVKKASPSKGILRADFDPVQIAQAYELGGANCLSVLTDQEFFQGGFANLAKIRAVVNLPLLCKEFIIDPYQILWARLHGADAVLLIAAILTDGDLQKFADLIAQLGMTALVEVHTAAELERVLKLDNVHLIGINNRNLENFEVTLAQTEALLANLSQAQRESYLWVSESGIYTRQDLDFVQACGAAAVLVGESLVKQPDITAGVQQLLLG
ncbi:MAG: indole-3-glycerol phosphate synthase TrpC [Pseudanabaena sp. ELA607]|jgi:indole-3-glycerol phosphate synthase